MNAENREMVWREMREMGDRLTGYLPPHRFHRKKGRNPYAHIALKVRCKFGMSYRDIPDERVPELMRELRSMEAWESRHGKRFVGADFRAREEWGLEDE